MSKYFYFINLDERGEFFADVRNENEKTVFEIHGYDIFEDGFMKHSKDMGGLYKHLVDMDVIAKGDGFYQGN